MSFSQHRESDFGTEIYFNYEHSSDVTDTISSASNEPHYVAFVDNLPYPQSTFNESECGEPTSAQRFTLDFTPGQNTELDTPAVRQKVMSFFEFINSQKDLAHLCQIPPSEYSSSQSQDTSVKKDSSISFSQLEKPTLKFIETHDAFQFMKSANYQKDCFQPESPRDSHEYEIDDNSAKDKGKPRNITTWSNNVLQRKLDEQILRLKKQHDRKELKKTCKEMDEFDRRTHKSMDSPGPVVPLIDAVLQRRPADPRAY